MRNFLAILFIIIINFSFGQKEFNQNIRGKIIDANTNLPMIGVNVVILNSNPLIGTSTNIEGDFILKNIKTGNYDIKVSFMGFVDVLLKNQTVTSRELVLEVKMKENILETDIVEVTASKSKNIINEMATVSVISISNIENNHIAGGLADPQRLVLSYAGVKNQGNINNGISIRGNKPTNMLWQLEGIEIQDPNHFTIGGAFGGNYNNGAVMSLSNNLVRNINLYTGSFPAEYGNAISGVMDLSLRNGNDKNFEYNFKIGLLGIESSAEGPMEMGGSFLVSFRYSAMGLVGDMGFDLGNSKLGYKDINYKINFPTKKLGTFTAFGLAGWSNTEDSKDFIVNEKLWATTYDNSVFGFSNKINLAKKSFLKTVVALSLSKNYFHFYEIKNNRLYKTNYLNKTKTYRISSTLKNSINNKNKIVTGLKASIPKVELKKEFTDNWNINKINFKNSTAYFQIFSQWKHTFNNKLSMNTGLHFLLFSYNWKNSLEPRFSLKWNLHKKHTINFGTGLHSKIEFLPIYMAEVNNTDYSSPYISFLVKDKWNKNLKLSKSLHISTNYIYNPFKNLSFKIEPYLQYHFDIPQITLKQYVYEPNYPSKPTIIDSFYTVITTLTSSYESYNYKLNNKGTGLNYGIEFTFNKQFSKNYYFLISSSIYRAFYKVPVLKKWKASSYDGLFTFASSVGKDFKIGKFKKNLVSLNTRSIWSGGYLTSTRFNNRYKNYYKLDSRIAYVLNKKKFSYTVALDVLNTTNHKNETREYLEQGSGIIPVLSFNLNFRK